MEMVFTDNTVRNFDWGWGDKIVATEPGWAMVVVLRRVVYLFVIWKV